MAGQVEEEHAILLRAEETGESDKRLCLLGEESGLLWVTAKGARKSRKRFVGALEPFTRGIFRANKYKRTAYLESVEMMGSRDRIPKQLGRFYLASYICELTSKLLRIGSPAPEYFALVRGLLDDMQASDELAHLLWRAVFEAEILELQGLLAAPDPELQEQPVLRLDVDSGCWMSPEASPSHGVVVDLDPRLWELFGRLRGLPLAEARAHAPEDEVFRPLNRATAYLIRNHVQLEVKSARLLNQWQAKQLS